MDSPEAPLLKVIAHLRGGKLLKGYTDVVSAETVQALLQQQPLALPPKFKIRLAGSQRTVTVALSALKALFFVKTFEGRKEYKEIKFFEANPPIQGLWVKLQFYDKEVTEGVVRNSVELLVKPGFFLKPPDPQSNNEILYVIKSSLTAFHVQGVQRHY